MDLSNINDFANQLMNPDGDLGREVGGIMAVNTFPMEMFAIDTLELQPSDSVLEIGFGPGEGLAEAARLTPEGYVAGLDHSETMLQMAKERNKRAIIQDRIELFLGEASAMPFPDAHFDKIFAVHVAHFWKDPLIELAEIKRVLKPNGIVSLYLNRPEDWPEGLAETGVFFARTPAQFEELMRKAGFIGVHTVTKKFTEEKEGYCVRGTI